MHQVGGVRGVGRAVGIAHVFAVAVVRGDEQFAAEAQGFLDDGFHARVDGFHRLDGGLDHAGMADHVGVGEVEYHEIVILEFGNHGLGDLRRAHLRFEIISRHVLG